MQEILKLCPGAPTVTEWLDLTPELLEEDPTPSILNRVRAYALDDARVPLAGKRRQAGGKRTLW